MQTLNPWINCQGTTVHKHVHSWEAGLPLTCGMLLAPLYLMCNSMSELGHCGCLPLFQALAFIIEEVKLILKFSL